MHHAGGRCGGSINCTAPSFPRAARLHLVVNVGLAVANGTVLSNTATVSSSTTDPNSGNNSATATTTVTASADLSVTMTDSPDPVGAGNTITYSITVANAGPTVAASAAMTDTLPAGTTFASLVTRQDGLAPIRPWVQAERSTAPPSAHCRWAALSSLWW